MLLLSLFIRYYANDIYTVYDFSSYQDISHDINTTSSFTVMI